MANGRDMTNAFTPPYHDGQNPEDLHPLVTIKAGDVIQLDPEKHDWGALLCIVDEVKSWGVQCYWLHAERRGEPPNAAYYRAEHGTFKYIGSAEWLVRSDDG